jgi:hypothetical protein
MKASGLIDLIALFLAFKQSKRRTSGVNWGGSRVLSPPLLSGAGWLRHMSQQVSLQPHCILRGAAERRPCAGLPSRIFAVRLSFDAEGRNRGDGHVAVVLLGSIDIGVGGRVMNFVQSKDERLLAFYENVRRQVELDRQSGGRYWFAGEGVKQYAERLREEMDRRRLSYKPIDWPR